MELSNILQKRLSIVAILGVSVLMGLLWTVGDGVVHYASYYRRDSQVLGAKTNEQLQCIPQETIGNFLKETKKTVNLYAPDRTINFSLEPLLSCFAATGCESANFSCAEGKVSLVSSCVAEYFVKYPLEVEQSKIVSGSGAVAQVQIQDWSVNYANLTEQLVKAVNDEIQYCQIEGKQEQTRQNIANLQLVVSDELPSVKNGSFTKRFVEMDASKEKVYFWNDGVYQTLSLVHGARLPKEGIYKRSDVDFAKIMSGIESSYVERNTQDSDYVIVHN